MPTSLSYGKKKRDDFLVFLLAELSRTAPVAADVVDDRRDDAISESVERQFRQWTLSTTQ